MTRYQLTHEGYVIRDGDTKVPTTDTPECPNTNPDYLAYLAWLADGGAPLPADPTTRPIPISCTRRQGRLALLMTDHLQDVEALIDAIADPAERRAAQIEYEADTWERANPTVQAMWSALGGTPEQLDDLFAMAVTL